MTLGRVISAQQATLRTATIEIKALTVNGRQVTLALFRQLEREDLIGVRDDEVVLNGQAWGHVNYHPDKCAGDRAHLHVIWQKGDELRRANVTTGYPDWFRDWSVLIFEARVLAIARRMIATGEGEYKPPVGYQPGYALSGGYHVELPYGSARPALGRVLAGVKRRDDPRSSGMHELIADSLASLERVLGPDWAPLDWDATRERITKQERAFTRAQGRYNELYRELAALDQLFIAV